MRQRCATRTRNPLNLLTLLTLDLLLEILYRLPVKSLLKLKCVCKSLNSIISDPKFAKDHLRFTRQYHLLICSRGSLKKRDFILYDSRLPSILSNSPSTIPETLLKFPLNSHEIHYYAIDSCDGIICFTTQECNFKHRNMVVWNPCTRKFKTLPTLNLPGHTFNTLYGVGYDRFTDNYKVIVVACYQYYNSYKFCKTQVKVHTLGTNVWRRIPDFPSENKGAPEGHVGKFVSGAIHWAIKDCQDNDFSWVILSLDLGTESYQEILQPDYGLDERLRYFSLGVCRDCLCILAQTKTCLDIWVMKDYGNKDSWTKLFSVQFKEFTLGYASLLFIYEEDDQLLLRYGGELYVYNYKNGTAKKITEIRSLPSAIFSSNVYVESLVSP